MASARRRMLKRCAKRICRSSHRKCANELIKVLSQTGGHLGPNLGVVELTIALHRVFETPKDKFVFDVSHQGYVHKMFTGRLDRYRHDAPIPGPQWLPAPDRKRTRLLRRRARRHRSFRRFGNGRRPRSARKQRRRRRVAGDAAFTCGISYEALNNAKSQTKRFIVVLNDNEWSIAKNVGAIASYLNNIVDQSDLCAFARKGAAVSSKRSRGKTARAFRAQGRGRREEPARAERDL